MNYRAIFHIISILVLVLGALMLLTTGLSVIDVKVVRIQFLSCSLLTLLVGFAVYLLTRRHRGELDFKTGAREGYAVVAFSWIIASVICAIPFVVVSRITFVDAVFEAASGLTTTGASVISENLMLIGGERLEGGLESLPKSLLFWRCALNWIGGVGIVFFVLLVLPLMHLTHGKQLYNAEVPGMKTSGDQLTPRLITSVKWILVVYLCLTFLCVAMYWYFGMEPFDAICHAFSTVSTGGFSTKAASIGAYKNGGIEWCSIAFMFISACNFSLIIKMFISKKFTQRFVFLRDEEFRFYAVMIVIAVSFIMVALRFHSGQAVVSSTLGEVYTSLGDKLRAVTFQVVSLASTTGFCTSDYEAWKVPSALLVLGIAMFPCGCGGSTAGGMKCSRIIVLLKQLHYEITHCIFPRTLPDVRLSGERLDRDVIGKTFSFVILYLTIFVFVSLAVTLMEKMSAHPDLCNVRTAIGSALTCISNVGPGFGAVGPSGSFGWMTWGSKALLSLTMITGRLELYTVLVLAFPAFWRR